VESAVASDVSLGFTKDDNFFITLARDIFSQSSLLHDITGFAL
jgi:hypothetical protein